MDEPAHTFPARESAGATSMSVVNCKRLIGQWWEPANRTYITLVGKYLVVPLLSDAVFFARYEPCVGAPEGKTPSLTACLTSSAAFETIRVGIGVFMPLWAMSRRSIHRIAHSSHVGNF